MRSHDVPTTNDLFFFFTSTARHKLLVAILLLGFLRLLLPDVVCLTWTGSLYNLYQLPSCDHYILPFFIILCSCSYARMSAFPILLFHVHHLRSRNTSNSIICTWHSGRLVRTNIYLRVVLQLFLHLNSCVSTRLGLVCYFANTYKLNIMLLFYTSIYNGNTNKTDTANK